MTHPLVLIVLDGFGHRDQTEYNAIAHAQPAFWQQLWEHYPHALLEASGHYVGLPDGQMGNSEVGHLTIGSGRVIDQDLTRIDKAIADHSFFHHPTLNKHLQQLADHDRALHILGLLSPGGVHSHEQHIFALIKMAAQIGVKKVYIHAFLDGRDVPPRSAMVSLQTLEEICQTFSCGKIVSVSGRYYAMDRDQRLERTEKAYQAIVHHQSTMFASNAITALTEAYQRGEDDEFVQPTCIETSESVAIQPEDKIIFMNFRADRARQLSRLICHNHFQLISLTEYATDIPSEIIFSPQPMKNIFADVIAHHQLKQLRIAETEKYAHVTFFFNGGVETPYPKEDRILINSPKISTYDLQPEMSAFELTNKLVHAINSKQYDVIICNYANADMVGHSGNLDATTQAITTLDQCLKQVISAAQATNCEVLITADHGNAECMYDETTQQPHTAHTSEPVPFVYVGNRFKIARSRGELADVAPTMLMMLGIEPPKEMSGKSLLSL